MIINVAHILGSGSCTLTCGLTGEVCPPVSCQVANPSQCTGGTNDPCDDGYTQVGTKCWKKYTTQLDWLASVEACAAEGAQLASIASADEQTSVIIF